MSSTHSATAPGDSESGGRAERPSDLVGPFGKKAIRIGRVFGIEVGLDWSWIFIFLLITLSLAQGFAAETESWSRVQSWSGAILASLLFFGSILLHELGHSVTSIALGIPVRSITLFIFGGLAQMSGEPKRPRDEFLIAAAGPVVSILLGLGFLAAAAFVPGEPAAANVVGAVFGWVGRVNLILAAFNLVPGFPLDGGRLLRSLVWSATDSFERATRIAAAVGSTFAGLLILGGILIALVGGALFNGLWLAFIGWFLRSAAQGSTLQVVLERQLGGLRAGPAAAPLGSLVPDDTTVSRAIEEVVLRQGMRTFFVGRQGEPAGLVTLHQLKAVAPEERDAVEVGSVMVPAEELVTISPDDTLWSALQAMNDHQVSQVPVASDGRLVGVLTRERLLGIIHSVQELDRARP